MNIDHEKLKQMEQRLRLSNRKDGSFNLAVEDTFECLRTLITQLTDARFSAVAYLGRAQRAEEAHKELVILQDLYERAKRDVERLSSQAEIFRQSWLSCRDKLEAKR